MSVTKKFKEIIEGWGNHIFGNEKIKEVASKRAFICANCPLNTHGVCDSDKKGIAVVDFEYNTTLGAEQRVKGQEYNGCACPLTQKTKSPTSKCPIGKWEKV